jgi:uncharacterized repeat protein (TIGR01451 family)
MRRNGAARGRGLRHTGWLAAFAAAALLSLGLPGAAAAGSIPVQIFYVAIPEEEFRTYAQAQANLAENDTQTSVISLTATFNGTVIYYDQWEDGYEYDITVPTQSTTKVWGDNLASTGCPPIAACGTCTDACDVINAGDVVTLQNNVPVPAGVRNQGNIFYDGRDKIATTQQLVATHAMWPSAGVQAQLGGSVEMFDTQRWGKLYDVPLGTNVATPANDFGWVALSIMAQKDGTLVEVDRDANGTYETTTTLNEGQTYFSLTTVQRGAKVRTSYPAQVNMLTCDNPSTYNGRLYPLLPTSSWGNAYYSPVPTTVEGGGTVVNAYVVLFNPDPTNNIQVTATTGSGSSNLTVNARSTNTYTMPQNTAVRFQSTGAFAGSPFYAVAAIDNNTVHNWGFTLIPRETLTTSVVAGWSPGSTDRQKDASPLWVTPDASTTVYIDYDGDPTTGPSTVTVPGLAQPVHYNTSVALTALQSYRVFSPGPAGSYDHTGYRLFTVDNTKLAVAWGQDGANSSSGQPTEFDLGTTVIPYPTLTAYKSGALVGDFNGNGGIDPGEVVQYTVRVYNSGIVPITTINLLDTLDLTKMTYVADTSTVANKPIADDLAGTTRFPFDEGGYPLPIDGGYLLPGQEIVVTLQVTVNLGASGELLNQAKATSTAEIFLNSVTAIVQPGALQTVKTSSAPSLGRDLRPGDTVDYTVTVTNVGTADQTGIVVTDPQPPGATYASATTVAGGWREKLVRDNFDQLLLTNNDGPESWAGPWVESDGAQDPAAGNVQVVNGELRLLAAAASAVRTVNLAGLTGRAALSFRWRSSPGVVAANSLVAEVSTNGGGAYTALGTVTGVTGQSSGTLTYNLTVYAVANTMVRFRTPGVAAANYFAVDQVQVRATGATKTASDAFAAVAYGGGANWGAAWVETDNAGAAQDATVGNVMVAANAGNNGLRLKTNAFAPAAAVGNAATRRIFADGVVGATLGFDLANVGASTGTVAVEASSDGVAFTTLATLNAAGSYAYDIGAYLSSRTTVRFRVATIDATNAGARYHFVDNVTVTAGKHAAQTKDDAVGANPDLLSGVPPTLVQQGDGFALAPGETLTITYRVTVDAPASVTRLANTATATSFEHAPPSSSTTVDPVSAGGAIGDAVWLDANFNGLYDVGEQGLVNVRVWLDADADGVYDAGDRETLTSARGNYAFDSLSPGTYRVYVDAATLPPGLVLTGAATNPSASLTVTTNNEIYEDVDFGYRPAPGTAAIGNFVWSDASGDGVEDVGEIGISGVRMGLASGAGADGFWNTADDVIVARTTTGMDGTYLFTNVAKGTYRVIADLGPDGLPASGDEVLVDYTPTIGPQSAGANVSVARAVDGQTVTDLDFGFLNPAFKSITDRVWFDANDNGLQDPGEPGIAGVTVNLLNPGGTVKGTAITDAGGAFTFSGLPDGPYTVSIEDAGGKLIGFSGTTVAAQSGSLAVTLSGVNLDGAHFGYNAPGSIGDLVWSDADGDGAQDPGEPGLANVTVRLYFDTNGNGLLNIGTDALVDTKTTDAAGRYLFTVDTPGRYFTSIDTAQAALSGYALTTSDPDPAAGAQVRVDLYNLLTSDLSADYGFRNPARRSVAGTVFSDADRNGAKGGAETGLTGVTIDLLDAGGIVIATTTTAADGSYAFTGLPDASYTVRVTDTGGVLDAWVPTAPSPAQRAVTVSGADVTGQDFGFYKPPTLAFVRSLTAVRAAGGGVVVSWETTSETGTAGYFLRRLENGVEVPVNERIVPALVQSAGGGRYALADAGATGTRLAYTLVEVPHGGALRTLGPYFVTPASGTRSAAAPALAPAPGADYARAARTSAVPPARPPAAPAAGAAAVGTRVRLTVAADGIHRVDAAAIAPLLGLTTRRARELIAGGQLSLSTRGNPVAYRPVAGGEALLFFGRAADTVFSGEGVYWLARGAGLLMRRAATATPVAAARDPQTFLSVTHAEQQNWPDLGTASDPGADYWMWDYLSAGDAVEGVKSFAVAAPDPAPAGTATLAVRLRGATESGVAEEHRVAVRVNGAAVGEGTFTGLATPVLSFSFDQSLLLPGGGNTVEVEAALGAGVPYSVVYVDSFDLSYQRAYRAVGDRLALRGDGHARVTVTGFSSPDVRVFDLGNPGRPKVVTAVLPGGSPGDYHVTFKPATATRPYLAVSGAGLAAPAAVAAWSSTGLARAANGAELVIVTDDALAGAAAGLAAHRSAQGISAMVVPVGAIMDEFNHGLRDPAAIRAFLARARAAWAVPPRYVLLAGDGGYDYRDYLGHGDCVVPPAMVRTPWGLFASDTWYADLDGDRVPDFAVGRIPARTAAELQAVVDKLLAYEGGPAGGWLESALFAADRADAAGNFAADSDTLRELVPADYVRDRAYLGPGTTLAQARSLIAARVGGGVDGGAALVSYLGHAGLGQLSDEGLLVTADVASMGNGPQLPLFAIFSCLAGSYAEPGEVNIGEALLMRAGGGAAAVLAPTGLAINDRSVRLAAEFLTRRYGAGGGRLGDLWIEAAQAFGAAFPGDATLEVYGILGDPTLTPR